ncbi:MAG: ATP-grasp domain-containing protein [Capsulimonadaceae bacterium]
MAKVQVVPYTNVMPDIPDEIDLPIVIYGMNTMIQNTYRHPKWKHGLFFEPASFEPIKYTKQLGELMLNPKAELLTCSELAESCLDPAETFFLRPNDDAKAFTGQLLSFRDYLQWYEQPPDPEYVQLAPELLVLYSTPKSIKAEYRAFVVDKKVITASQYLPDMRKFTPPEVVEFAEHVAARYSPADAFVCDIANTPDGLRVVEFNCINGSGFYAADVNIIVRSLSIWKESNCVCA